ncbi:GNAT family N-acetyltransferase [Thermococci archaeon]|uniref:GNAT family N-acetyltransferase n=1 Tax=Pyrococcus kukulkanii TaxID=1609559 RepID=UPI000F1D3E4A|nr:MAG: GNAT family N-acetyltransferase [Thermococci archaeon]
MEPIIREAEPKDKKGIEELARSMGGDYIPEVFDEWVGDNFFVLELNGKIIGTAKLTLFPNRVLWMEGLRVHPEFRGKGFGKMLHNFLLAKGEELAKKGIAVAMEFVTNRFRSLSAKMALKTGFRIIGEFYNLRFRPSSYSMEKPSRSSLTLEDINLELIPVGYRFVHPSKEALRWILTKGEVYEYQGIKFIKSKDSPKFTPLSYTPDAIRKVLPAMAWLSKNSEEARIILPGSIKGFLEDLFALGFYMREKYPDPPLAVFRRELLGGGGAGI